MRKARAVILSVLGLAVLVGCQSTSHLKFQTKMQKFKLTNGLEVLKLKDHSLPYFRIVLWSNQGVGSELSDQLGSTYLVSELFKEGTQSKDKKQILGELSSMGAGLSSYVVSEQTRVSTSALSEDALPLAKLFAELILKPNWSNRSILEKKQKAILNIKRIVDAPGSLLGVAVNQHMYEGHVYERLSLGSLSTLAKLTKNQLMERYKVLFQPQGLKLALIGNWSKEAESALLSEFSDLKNSKFLQPGVFAKVPVQTRANLFFTKSGLQQAGVKLTLSSISRAHPDYEALKVGLFVLGGSFQSRLNAELRIKRGLTYGASASLDVNGQGGIIQVGGSVRHDKLIEFVTEAEHLLKKAAQNGITQIELDKAKAYIKGQFPRALETKESEVSAYLSLEAMGVKGSELYSYLDKVHKLTLTEINEALFKHLNMKTLNVLVLGDVTQVPQASLRKIDFKIKNYSHIKL